MNSPATADVETVGEVPRAGVLLHPLRLEILSRAREPRSATEIAALLDLPRQKVNYHVRELARAGFLRRAGQRRRRNLLEQRYRSTARAYLLSPEVLGPVAVDDLAVRDRASAAYLLALAAQVQREVARASGEAAARDERLPTLSVQVDLRFESAAQRSRFASALRDAVADVIARHSSPARRPDGAPARGRPYRLVVGSYPAPPGAPPAPEAKEA